MDRKVKLLWQRKKKFAVLKDGGVLELVSSLFC